MPEMTTRNFYGYDSYPYLHIAQRLRVPYGRVLAYVDAIERNDGFEEFVDIRIAASAIHAAYTLEQQRRRS